ncbi:tRNA dihydrouridine synthase DusB [Rhodobacter maris]|uniref:tRNA-dihydrouridine synthase n=1 Tax=Rhodobacter maris TaxID=446682 RepID=A0A285ST92_9RHOB|nr:tRNA dihydrouridine synthase DusB [Rhodobacter maris]SOC11717.1 tRNA-U20-dihydrouridine synthase [Rhodobacter maris]
MTITLDSFRLDPPVLLAPMAGITDLPFRRIVARFGAGLVVSEMVASGEMLTAKPSVRAKARSELGLDLPSSVQLAGREARPMAEAAKVVADMGAKIIDINMGCPAKKVTGGASGAALMRDPDHALRLIEAVVGAVDLPVTLKMRLGWDEGQINAPEIARRAESAGVRMIVVHGRTRMQFYEGRADWGAIAAVSEAVSVPVVANGDIVDAPSARMALARAGAAGVMVGRGAQGAPWRLAQIAAALYGAAPPKLPKGAGLVDLVSEHYEAILGFYGEQVGLRLARKHLRWYAEVAGAALVPEMMRAQTPEAALALIRAAFSERAAA